MDEIKAISCSKDGKYIACGTGNGNIILFTASGKKLMSLKAHRDIIGGLALRKGRRVLTAE